MLDSEQSNAEHKDTSPMKSHLGVLASRRLSGSQHCPEGNPQPGAHQTLHDQSAEKAITLLCSALVWPHLEQCEVLSSTSQEESEGPSMSPKGRNKASIILCFPVFALMTLISIFPCSNILPFIWIHIKYVPWFPKSFVQWLKICIL